MDSLKESELGRRAPDVLRGVVQTIFQGHPNLRFATPYGPMEMSPGDFFSQPADVQDLLKRSVIHPTPLSPQQGLRVSQQGSEVGGLAQAGVSAENTPVMTAAPEGQAASEGTSQSDAGTGTAVPDAPATNTPDTPVQTAPETAATPERRTATEASPQDEGITASVKKHRKKVAGGLATIGGRKPINSRYAGGWHPAGIEFSEQGFPKFGPHAISEVRVQGLTGKYAKDSAKANRVLGIPSTPDGYKWHHVEDGKTMQLIPSGIHRKVRHTGGAAVIRNGGLDKK